MSSVAAPPAAAFRGPLSVSYCAACSMPPEYCEYGPCFDKCKPLLEKNNPDILAAALERMNVGGAAAAPAAGEEAKEAKDGEASGDAAAAPAAAAPAGDDDEFLAAAAPVKPVKKAAASVPGIYLSMANRSKKKFITTIRGFDSFGLQLKDVSKLLAKKFATAASVVKATEGSEIALQGDLIQDLPYWIVEEFPQIDKKSIFTVDKAGKKVRAF